MMNSICKIIQPKLSNENEKKEVKLIKVVIV